MEAMMLMTTLAVCPTNEKSRGMAVLMASLKSRLLKNFSISDWLACNHPCM